MSYSIIPNALQNQNNAAFEVSPLPTIDCPYQETDVCAATQSPVTGCCNTQPTGTAGAQASVSSLACSMFLLMSAIIAVLL